MMEQTTRVAVFIDGANMFYAQRALGWRIDWAKVISYFSKGKKLYNGFYYAAESEGEFSQESFLRALTHMGYIVRRRPLKSITDQETGATIYKANLDVDIVVDMLATMDQYDEAILMSGDGDFERAFELLRARGKAVHCASIRSMVAFELLNASDSPRYFLEDLRSELQRGAEAVATEGMLPGGVEAIGIRSISNGGGMQG
ncbi:MAG: NYN domain-containing protein [Limnochordaceae bacterium]|nr:NYN domain-containing protein [Limnochordaceae bacterium]